LIEIGLSVLVHFECIYQCVARTLLVTRMQNWLADS